MRIVFNSLATLRPKTGVGHYAAHLVDALSQQLEPGTITCFPNGSMSAWLQSKTKQAHRPSRSPGIIRPWMSGAAKSLGRSALGALFHFQHGPDRFDLYHEPNFLPLSSRLPTVITVHDLSVLLHPEWHPVDRVKRHESQFRKSVAQAKHVITVSEAVRHDVIKHLGIDPAQVTAIHNGVSEWFFDVGADDIARANARLQLPNDYLLYCGTIEPRKNLETLLRAYCALPDLIRDRCPLILAGGWGWKSEPVADYYESVARHRGVRAIGYVNDDVRIGLFAQARALLFPSHHEGFGIPPVEMLACGGAVLASDIPVHHEVLGRQASFIDPNDVNGWTNAMALAISDNDWLSQLKVGSRDYARHFRWDRSAQQTLAVYRKVVSLRKAA